MKKKTISFVFEMSTGDWGWTEVNTNAHDFIEYKEEPKACLVGLCRTTRPEETVKRMVSNWFVTKSKNVFTERRN